MFGTGKLLYKGICFYNGLNIFIDIQTCFCNETKGRTVSWFIAIAIQNTAGVFACYLENICNIEF